MSQETLQGPVVAPDKILPEHTWQDVAQHSHLMAEWPDDLKRLAAPHLEQAMQGMTPQVEGVIARADERGESSEVISSEHHQEHIGLARDIDPGIDTRTPHEQDLIGEVIEIGDTSLQDAGLEAKAEAGVVVPPEFASLVSRGGSVEGLRNLLGETGDPKRLTAKPEHLSEEDFEVAQNLAAELSSIEGMNFRLEGFVDDAILTRLYERPKDYVAVIPKLKSSFDAAVVGGYPADRASQSLNQVFSNYFGNRIPYFTDGTESPGTAAEAARLNYLQAEGESMALLGDRGIRVQELTGAGYDPALSEMTKYWRPEDAEHRADVLANVDSTRRDLQDLADNHPDIYQAFQETAVSSSNLLSLAKDSQFAHEVANHSDVLNILKDQIIETDPTGSSEFYMRTLRRLVTSRDVQDRVAAEGHDYFDSFSDLEVVLKADTGMPPSALADAFIGQTDMNKSQKLRDLLTSDDFKALTQEPRMATLITRNLGTLGFYAGSYDFKRLTEGFGQIEGAPDKWFAEMLSAECKLSSQATEYFYGEGVKRLAARDKDGNFYDAPDFLADMLKDYGTGDPAANETVDWYSRGNLPIAAFRGVTSLRQEAVQAGVADEPGAIHEWIYKNPETINHLSAKNLREYVKQGIQLEDGADEIVEELVQQAYAQAERREDGFRVFLNISLPTLEKVAQNGGHIKSILDKEVGDAGKISYPFDVRSGVEIALGIRSMDDGTDHRVYGTAGYLDSGIPSGAIGYGEIMLAYRETPDLAARTSYTPEDSFHGANRLTAADAKALRLIKSGRGQEFATTKDYVESQISGLELAEASEIYVGTEQQEAAIRALLPPDSKTAVIVRDASSEYRPTQEEALYQLVIAAEEAARRARVAQAAAQTQSRRPTPATSSYTAAAALADDGGMSVML
jgi:hypothetical protein